MEINLSKHDPMTSGKEDIFFQFGHKKCCGQVGEYTLVWPRKS